MKLINLAEGFWLNYEGVRVNLSSYQSWFRDALKFMAQLEEGAIVNPTENTQVGTYWLRNPAVASPQIAEDIKKEWVKLRNFFETNSFESLIYAGIGGSSLGPMLIAECFKAQRNKKVVVLDNVDVEGLAIKLCGINLASSLVCVASKSGSTTETAVVAKILQHLYLSQGLPFNMHAVAVTMEGSKLWEEAKNWAERFKIWDWVRGRMSITSAVGLVVTHFLNLDTDAFLRGASWMDNITRENDIQSNPAGIIACCLIDATKRSKHNLVVLPYSDRLELFSKYLQQLFMESLGKEVRKNGVVENHGITVYGNKGTTDQHSFIQQLQEGRDDFTVCFIRRLHPDITLDDTALKPFTADSYLDAFYLGTREALSDKKREWFSIIVPKVDEFNLGALIALFERVVGFYAHYFGINAYDQPGVEAGKKAASKWLQSGEDLKKIP